ncbi:MAG: A/G-specific adenine glycosylase [Planctomycetales bacterium]|nr:A/G-specific adenine glycosylase [Planctomycetales bacterium]
MSRTHATTPTPRPKDAQWRSRLRRRLFAWFGRNARELPWRGTTDPYHVWLSEIMLQQTQVATVESYYPRFLAALPAIADLAAADEETVLRLWEGLGYYRRARQLREAARQIVAEHGGVFPRAFDDVVALPGIGRYTAGAILSIAFDQRQPILEANTVRLYARLLDYDGEADATAGQKQLWAAAESWLPRRDVGTFNQALMEIGALVCRPRDPDCDVCPLADLCVSRARGTQLGLPKLKPRRQRKQVRTVAVVVRRDAGVLVVKRNGEDNGRWPGLWDFPRFDVPREASRPRLAALVTKALATWGVRVALGERLTTMRHAVTHHDITLECYNAECSNAECQAIEVGEDIGRPRPQLRWVRPGALADLPLNVTARRLADLVTESSD